MRCGQSRAPGFVIVSHISSIIDQLNYANPAFFRHTLDWQLKLSQRYPEADFSVLGMRITNADEWGEQHGERRLVEALTHFNSVIAALLRNTDLCTQTPDRIYWLLLPHTTAAGAEGFLQRLAQVWSVENAGDATLRYLSAQFASDKDVLNLDAERVLEKLRQSLMAETSSP
jgi:hypothetical protein